MVEAVTQFNCPSCRLALEPPAQGPTQCPACRWKGYVYLFSPKPLDVTAAEQALPDDACCIHHPTKKATAVCAGTGDFVCALCAVEVDGKTYSAEYLNIAAKNKKLKAFDRYLPRPDSQIILYCILCFVPYVNAVVFPLAFIWIPYSYVLYRRALQQRRADPVFARVMGRGRIIAIPILLVVFALLWLASVLGITYLILRATS